MTQVLITNDDGISSPGLCELARIAIGLGLDVAVAAPRSQSSGASASILGTQEDGSIRFAPRTLPGLPGLSAFSVDAAPGLIALVAAHGAFGPPPEVVLSGINRGANVGHAILHSGTVGAALTAGVNGARGLAVSLDVGLDPDEEHWAAAAPFVESLLPALLDSPIGTVFNLNVPNSPDPTELREGPLAAFGIVQTTMTAPGAEEQDGGGVRLSVADIPSGLEPGSDAALLAAGFATVTAVQSVSESPYRVLVESPSH